MALPPFLGLTGPNSAGKGAVAEHLAAAHGYRSHSLSDLIREEARTRGLEPVREVMIDLGNELREREGPGALAVRLVASIRPPAIVDSIRTPVEVEVLRRLEGFVLVAIDAPMSTRFERSRVRARPGDPATADEFVAREKQENTSDPARQQLDATRRLADEVLLNDGSLEQLHARVDELLLRLGGEGPA